MPPTLVAGVQVQPHLCHEFLHSLAAVVTCYVVVQVFPHPLDTVVVGAVRWQEVEFYPAGRSRLQGELNLLAVMDAVVVENEMYPTSAPVRLCHQFVEEVQEQEAVLLVPFNPCELPGFG